MMVKVTHRHTKDVVAIVELVEDDHWTSDGKSYKVFLDGERIGTVESYQHSEVRCFSGLPYGYQTKPRLAWDSNLANGRRATYAPTSSRLEALRYLLQSAKGLKTY